MKNLLKYLIAIIVSIAIVRIGIWGIETNLSQTTDGWIFFGWLLAVLVIGVPTFRFWMKAIGWIIDLDETYGETKKDYE
jgi:hypothetical protein